MTGMATVIVIGAFMATAGPRVVAVIMRFRRVVSVLALAGVFVMIAVIVTMALRPVGVTMGVPARPVPVRMIRRSRDDRNIFRGFGRELRLAPGRPEVVGAPLILGPVLRLLRIDVHAADGVVHQRCRGARASGGLGVIVMSGMAAAAPTRRGAFVVSMVVVVVPVFVLTVVRLAAAFAAVGVAVHVIAVLIHDGVPSQTREPLRGILQMA
jgi:hypothetical protein